MMKNPGDNKNIYKAAHLIATAPKTTQIITCNPSRFSEETNKPRELLVHRRQHLWNHLTEVLEIPHIPDFFIQAFEMAKRRYKIVQHHTWLSPLGVAMATLNTWLYSPSFSTTSSSSPPPPPSLTSPTYDWLGDYEEDLTVCTVNDIVGAEVRLAIKHGGGEDDDGNLLQSYLRRTVRGHRIYVDKPRPSPEFDASPLRELIRPRDVPLQGLLQTTEPGVYECRHFGYENYLTEYWSMSPLIIRTILYHHLLLSKWVVFPSESLSLFKSRYRICNDTFDANGIAIALWSGDPGFRRVPMSVFYCQKELKDGGRSTILRLLYILYVRWCLGLFTSLERHIFYKPSVDEFYLSHLPGRDEFEWSPEFVSHNKIPVSRIDPLILDLVSNIDREIVSTFILARSWRTRSVNRFLDLLGI